jgi:hypothetical protein
MFESYKVNKNVCMKDIVLTKQAMVFLAIACFSSACSKSSTPPNNNGGGSKTSTYPVITDSTYNPVDPSTPATVGFFSSAWTARTFAEPAQDSGATAYSGVATDSLTINVNEVLSKASPYVFGNNSNLWIGQMVTQPTLMQYITDLTPHIIRGPGGSISDVYFWNGTTTNPAPADAPANLLTATGTTTPLAPWYGTNIGTWTLSLDNYYTLLSQTGSTGILTMNYGYARYGTGPNPVAAAAHLAADWVRYDNGRTKYWEIGNENFGNWEAGYQINTSTNQDGQPALITGALYGAHFQVFADSMRAAAQQVGATIYIGAVLYNTAPLSTDYASLQTWNQGVLAGAGSIADFFIVHDYFTAYDANSSVSDILNTGITEPKTLMTYIESQISGAGVASKPIALTEWNIQATGSKQNTSYIAGIHAALTLGNLIKNNFGESSRWDLGNGYDNGDDMGMFNDGDEPNAPLWNPRPAFYYMYYFQKYVGDRMVYDTLRRTPGNTDIYTYSSTFSSGQAGTTIINTGSLTHIVSIDFQHFPAGSKYYYYILTGGADNPPFSSQVYVNGTGPATPTGGPLNYSTLKPYSVPLTGTIKISVPPLSVIYLVADHK